MYPGSLEICSLLHGPVTLPKAPYTQGDATAWSDILHTRTPHWLGHSGIYFQVSLYSMLMHSWRWSPSSHHPVTALRYRGSLWIWKGISLTVASGPRCAGARTSVPHPRESTKERGPATRPVAAWAQKVRKSQVLHCWHSDLSPFMCLAPFLLPTVLFSLACLLCRRDQEAWAN